MMLLRYFIIRILALSIVSVIFDIAVVKNKIFAASFRYHVRKGDNLEKIARKYKVSVTKILHWNRLQDKNKIFRGQKLRIFTKVVRKYKRKRSRRISRDLEIRPLPKGFINFKRPVKRWRILKGFDSFGDETNYGVLCRIRSSSKVFTSYRGRVTKVGEMRGYGRFIVVDHGKGWLTLYSNLNKIMIKKGQRVFRSRAMATAKNRKLFFVVSYKGKPLNPLAMIENTFL